MRNNGVQSCYWYRNGNEFRLSSLQKPGVELSRELKVQRSVWNFLTVMGRSNARGKVIYKRRLWTVLIERTCWKFNLANPRRIPRIFVENLQSVIEWNLCQRGVFTLPQFYVSMSWIRNVFLHSFVTLGYYYSFRLFRTPVYTILKIWRVRKMCFN